MIILMIIVFNKVYFHLTMYIWSGVSISIPCAQTSVIKTDEESKWPEFSKCLKTSPCQLMHRAATRIETKNKSSVWIIVTDISKLAAASVGGRQHVLGYASYRQSNLVRTPDGTLPSGVLTNLSNIFWSPFRPVVVDQSELRQRNLSVLYPEVTVLLNHGAEEKKITQS